MSKKGNAAHAGTGGKRLEDHCSTFSPYDAAALIIGIAALAALLIVPRIIAALAGAM